MALAYHEQEASPLPVAINDLRETSEPSIEVRLKELELRGREIDLPMQLARLGMRGTLIGFIAAALVLITLAIVSIFAPAITGTHLCVMSAIICSSVALYGGFVFQRSVHVALGPRTEQAESASPR